MTGRPILTATQLRAAEAAAIAAGTPARILMERAGEAAAEAILRFAGPLPALILCGPGNNGGDGYVVARRLRERGAEVRVAALAAPGTPDAAEARARWTGNVESLAEARSAPLLVDALFGTGLVRPLAREAAERFGALAAAARVVAALDLPSGAASDDGALLSPVPRCDLTIAFAALKPSHLLQPAAARMGRTVVADIGIAVSGDIESIGRPRLRAPRPEDHKFSRGFVALLGGAMPGAAALGAAAALRSGAGYVRLLAPETVLGAPGALVQGPAEPGDVLADPRLSAVVVGPGLGRDANARSLFALALAADAPLVVDGDALSLAAEEGASLFRRTRRSAVLTPHEGEFARLFGALSGSKIDRARAAAREAGAVVVFKGADTVVAAPDGRVAVAAPTHWLATAGTGDVLAGTIGAMRAGGLEGFEAACAGVWLHARAGVLAGRVLIADDLLAQLPAAVRECL